MEEIITKAEVPAKAWWKSKTVQVAIFQSAVGIAISVLSFVEVINPEWTLFGLGLNAKSMVDILNRISTYKKIE